MESIEIRESLPSDIASIEKLYPDAFPDEDLLPLVRELLQQTPIVLSLVGIIGTSLVGHIMFTTCGIAADTGAADTGAADAGAGDTDAGDTDAGDTDKVALLAPLAVVTARQRQGVGSAIVRAGLQRLGEAGVIQVYVLGDPAYYGRVGFGHEIGVAPPYPLPEEWRGAWQSINLSGAEPPNRGKLAVPQPWLQPALWAP